MLLNFKTWTKTKMGFVLLYNCREFGVLVKNHNINRLANREVLNLF